MEIIDRAEVAAQVKEAAHRQALFDEAKIALARNDINAALREHMESRRGRTLEQTLRRVLREELGRSPRKTRWA